MNQPRSSAAQRRRDSQRPDGPSLRTTIYDIIFEHDTPAGFWFDIGLLAAILTSVVLVSLETVGNNASDHRDFFYYSEWFMTILFTIEYGLRLYCVRRPLRYAFSFWGVIDLLSILPTYVAAMTAGSRRLIRGHSQHSTATSLPRLEAVAVDDGSRRIVGNDLDGTRQDHRLHRGRSRRRFD